MKSDDGRPGIQPISESALNGNFRMGLREFMHFVWVRRKGGDSKFSRKNAGFLITGFWKRIFIKWKTARLRSPVFKVGPPASSDRLYLVAASGLAPFRPLYDALSRMGFYNLNPDEIRELQPPDAGEVLKRDGSNLASVLSVMAKGK